MLYKDEIHTMRRKNQRKSGNLGTYVKKKENISRKRIYKIGAWCSFQITYSDNAKSKIILRNIGNYVSTYLFYVSITLARKPGLEAEFIFTLVFAWKAVG